MAAPSYAASPVPVREDLVAAHRRAWERLARPGSWWSGAERVALAAEVRDARTCTLCRARKQALSPHAVPGEHVAARGLPAAAVEVVHRVTTDPGRLSKAWFEAQRDAGLADGPYVEALGVVATVVSIDAFCRGLGLPPHPLPRPEGGVPSRYRPPGALPEGAWVPMIKPRNAGGAEADLYPGRTGNVIRALSLVPDEVRGLQDLSRVHYLSVDQMFDFAGGRGALDRRQVELVAGRVSARNECFY